MGNKKNMTSEEMKTRTKKFAILEFHRYEGAVLEVIY